MDANKYYFKIPVGSKSINLPFEIKWDNHGQEDSIEIWEEDTIKEVIGLPKDFEILRFAHSSYGEEEQTKLNYCFYFWDYTANTYNIDFINEGFTIEEINFVSNSFKRSFFKLDFYDTKSAQTQTNYFSIILQPIKGKKIIKNLQGEFNNGETAIVNSPEYELDFIKNIEGFFIYWMRDKSFYNLDTFYMTAKFFDAKRGLYVKMMNTDQSTLPSPNTSFDGTNYFYYKVILDYNNFDYKLYDSSNNRIGDGTPINWYEYVNPPA